MASSLTDTQGIVALAAGGVAVVALAVAIALAVSLRRVRRNQRVVLGDLGAQDVVAHAATMQDAFRDLQDYVEEAAVRLDGRLAEAERTMRGVIAHRALVRYDAYNELSGQQSMSIALLDEDRSGIVLSCIHHRDQARVYGKQVHDGRGEIELSPEEAEAVRLALAGGGSPGVASAGGQGGVAPGSGTAGGAAVTPGGGLGGAVPEAGGQGATHRPGGDGSGDGAGAAG